MVGRIPGPTCLGMGMEGGPRALRKDHACVGKAQKNEMEGKQNFMRIVCKGIKAPMIGSGQKGRHGRSPIKSGKGGVEGGGRWRLGFGANGG